VTGIGLQERLFVAGEVAHLLLDVMPASWAAWSSKVQETAQKLPREAVKDFADVLSLPRPLHEARLRAIVLHMVAPDRFDGNAESFMEAADKVCDYGLLVLGSPVANRWARHVSCVASIAATVTLRTPQRHVNTGKTHSRSKLFGCFPMIQPFLPFSIIHEPIRSYVPTLSECRSRCRPGFRVPNSFAVWLQNLPALPFRR
jgi:hypothetical protein